MQHGLEGRPARILLAATGSVAAIKFPQLCRLLQQLGEVKVASTKAASYFIKQQQLPQGIGPVAGDEDEWHEWQQVGDPVMHIELRRWADVFIIAPLSANSLAKMANGLCDNLVTCVARAWDFSRPLLVGGPWRSAAAYSCICGPCAGTNHGSHCKHGPWGSDTSAVMVAAATAAVAGGTCYEHIHVGQPLHPATSRQTTAAWHNYCGPSEQEAGVW
eukprot:GHRR01020575.1.p1 GENE.GHRR01020575.1~~GHRR01020575.1.p1  ORF type:complete len:217 (+),score=63.03 GHRR01020575.1:273-923(+)